MSRLILTYFAFPIVVFFSKLFRRNREKFEQWFINKNNKLVQNIIRSQNKFQPKNLLLLLPHCLQFDDCKHRIVKTILNCEECGKCKISDILKLTKKYDIIIKVATGGRLAKRFVEELNPDFVVAVACERELSEGISAVYPLPVIGIPNVRPYGPCVSTTVDVTQIENVLYKVCNVVAMVE